MNQFAQLLSAEKQTTVLLDCCTIIGAKNGSLDALQFRKKIANRKDIKILVPSIIVREVCKVGRMAFDEAIALIDTFSLTGQIEYVSCSDIVIKSQAEALTAKYPVFCHYPDDHYLAIAKKYGALLVTYDRNLKDVARLEGVQTCAPLNSRIHG
jgi:predicted nucleic acid-binding protein